MRPECKYYGCCEAALCPLDSESLEHGIWYPDEAICRLRRFQTLSWVKKQKQIAKKHGSIEGFFNLKMLNAIERVAQGIVGADPDEPLSKKADEKWIGDLEKGQQRLKRHRQKTGVSLASANEKITVTSKLRNERS